MRHTPHLAGGSAGAGGYNYQASAYALIASKVLNGTQLDGWADIPGSGVPVWISSEVGSGGDDIRIGTICGSTLDIQAKHGLERGDRLWKSLISLAKHVSSTTDAYGVLLVDQTSSSSVRNTLARDLIRIGSGRQDGLSDIAIDFTMQLQSHGLTPQSVCSRIRIITRSLEPGGSGQAEAIAELYHILENPQDSNKAFLALQADGHAQIEYRLTRTQADLALYLSRHVPLKQSSQSPSVVRANFIRWQQDVYATFEIPPINLTLPLEKATIELKALTIDNRHLFRTPLEMLEAYHQSYASARTTGIEDILTIDDIIASKKHSVIVGGPGSGKSTLSRRVMQIASETGQLALRIPLSTVGLRMQAGESFEEALEAVAPGSFNADTATLRAVLRTTTILVADGLDESDPNRLKLAEELTKWAASDPSRQVIVTTRPSGHNPNWFANWNHLEILPLTISAVENFTREAALIAAGSTDLKAFELDFFNALESSGTATIACRNPQLLSFLIALHMSSGTISGTKFELYDRIIRLAMRTHLQDAHQSEDISEPLQHRVLQLIAWFSITIPGADEQMLVEHSAEVLTRELAKPKLQVKLSVVQCLRALASRRILERITFLDFATYTFVHMSLVESLAAQYLANLTDDELVSSIHQYSELARFRHTLSLLGGTSKADIAISALLARSSVDDPISNGPVLASELLAEGRASENSIELVASALTERLSSPIPMVAFEAAERLYHIAPTVTEVLGPIAYQLMREGPIWTRKAAASLALRCGKDYVDTKSLLEIYPDVRDSELMSGRGGKLHIRHWGAQTQLLTRGAHYLIEYGEDHGLKVVANFFQSGQYSLAVYNELSDLLQAKIGRERCDSLRPHWTTRLSIDYFKDAGQAVERASQRLFELVGKALEDMHCAEVCDEGEPFVSMAHLFVALKLFDANFSDLYALNVGYLDSATVEVLRGVVSAYGIDRAGLITDLRQAQASGSTIGEIIDTIRDDVAHDINSTADWSEACACNLDHFKLIDALAHPSLCIAKPAAELLIACHANEATGRILRGRLSSARGFEVSLCVAVGVKCWNHGDAVTQVLERLENNLTPDCAPVVQSLPGFVRDDVDDRTKAILINALTSRHVDLVNAALSAFDEAGCLGDLRDTCLRELEWWIYDGPDVPAGGGIVPPSAARPLLEKGAVMGWLSFDQCVRYCNANRSDVRDFAVDWLCKMGATDERVAVRIIDGLFDLSLPPAVLDRLSMSYGSLCFIMIERLGTLSGHSDVRLRRSVARSFGDAWSPLDEAIELLRVLLVDEDASVREEALLALRARTQR